jgi:hypothetical protein
MSKCNIFNALRTGVHIFNLQHQCANVIDFKERELENDTEINMKYDKINKERIHLVSLTWRNRSYNFIGRRLFEGLKAKYAS